MRRSASLFTFSVASIGALSGCAHHSPPEVSPTALASLHAETRVVRGETTWVTHGRGYELVGHTRMDLATIQPALDRESAFLAQIFPRDTMAPIVAAIRRTSAPGKPFVGAAPVPVEVQGSRVELVVVDPKTLEEERKRNGGSSDEGPRSPIGAGATMPAVRAWLSARAARVTGTAGRLDQSRGEAVDPRIPAWAPEMVAAIGGEESIDDLTKTLALHSESLIPLATYFTMSAPEPMLMAGRGNRGSGESPSGGRGAGGGTGGMGGGRGGMGGGRMGGGRGGMGGGGGGGGERRGSGGSSERTFPLQGPALFATQSAVLSKYLARPGVQVVGELIDAQIAGKSIDDVLTKHNMGTPQQIDADFRSWLFERADLLDRR